MGHELAVFESVDLKLTIQGLCKLSTHLPKSKLPISSIELKLLVNTLDVKIPLHACMWVFLTFAFFGMLRASNLLCTSVQTYKDYEQLNRCDVQFSSEGLNLNVKWSKTRQTHEFLHVIPLAKCQDRKLCPVHAYLNLLEVIPGLPKNPVLGLPSRSDDLFLIPLCKYQIYSLFKQLLIKCDMEPGNYSLHSLRHGGATLAAKAGVSELMLKSHGDWRSNCYETYIKNAKASSFAVTKDMYKVLFA